MPNGNLRILWAGNVPHYWKLMTNIRNTFWHVPVICHTILRELGYMMLAGGCVIQMNGQVHLFPILTP